MSAGSGLTVREIYHRHFGITQLIHFVVGRLWLGFGEQGQLLSAPDLSGFPDLSKLFLVTYLDQDQVTFLRVLDPAFEPQCMVLPSRLANRA